MKLSVDQPEGIPKNSTMGRFGRFLSTGLKPYSGIWTDQERFHLLRRTLFGLSRDSLETFSKLNLDQCIAQLLTESPAPAPPINDYYNSEITDPLVPPGETWIYNSERDNDKITSGRIVSLKSWWIGVMLDHPPTMHEKMIFFWHNHLATQSWEVYWPHLTYYHFDKIRKNAFGNFKTLVKEISIDPHMLLYLNGSLNRQEAPDENYARELQELFCIGKGPDANFTEEDVQAAARVLTGHSIDWDKGGEYLYRWYWHDTSDKQFSSFYGNTVIKGKQGEDGAKELDELINMIFNQNEVAAFIVRKIYRMFVYSDIDEATEENVIAPLAAIFRDADYEVKPVLQSLLKSEHFFDMANRGAMIKTPLDFMIGFWRTGGVEMPSGANLVQQRQIRTSMLWTMNTLGAEVMDPPNVAGYPAYYQFPQFDRDWITTNSITTRALVTDSFVYWGYWSEDLLTNIDLIAHCATLPNPEDPEKLVDDLLGLHLAFPVSQAVRQRMISTLLSGQQNNYYWTSAWYDHQDNPGDAMKKATVELRLKVMFQFLLQLSEYHLL
jgi:uncharacterized protein (DUF1800 family)